MKKLTIAIVLAAAGVIAGLVFWPRPSEEPTPGERGQVRAKSQSVHGKKRLQAKKEKSSERKPKAFETRTNKKGKRIKVASGRMAAPSDGIYRDENGKPYSAADQKLLRQADRAVENDDVNAARALAESALGSSNPVVREAAVDALAWFGEKALVELTPFLSDKKGEIAEKAKDAWMQGLMEVEKDSVKATVIEVALRGIKDKDMIEDVANELVGIDEVCAIQTIYNLSESASGATSAALREAYETITGEKWSGAQAAEKWLQENYVTGEE